MKELKTKENSASVAQFIQSIDNKDKRADCKHILNLMKEITQAKPKMWGDSIVGFGKYSYTYASKHSGEWFIVGFSPRKQNITLYIMCGFTGDKKIKDLLEKLGPHKTGVSCLYIKQLKDVSIDVLKKIIEVSYANLNK